MPRYPLPMPLEPRSRRSRNGLKLAIFAPLLLGLTSCAKVSGLGYKEGLSSVNDTSLPLWQGAWITAGIVGVFTAGLILWASIFHRKKNEEFPRQTQYHVPIEVAYTIIPFIIVAVLFAYTARDESRITNKSPVGVKHNITVNAIQWSWQFTYPEAGPNATITGTPEQRPVLYLPQGERIRFELTSSDVDHGFWSELYVSFSKRWLPNFSDVEINSRRSRSFRDLFFYRRHLHAVFDQRRGSAMARNFVSGDMGYCFCRRLLHEI